MKKRGEATFKVKNPNSTLDIPNSTIETLALSPNYDWPQLLENTSIALSAYFLIWPLKAKEMFINLVAIVD